MSDTFFDMVTRWLDSPLTDLRYGTRKTYKAILTKFNKFAPGVKCCELTRQLVVQFKDYMLNTLKNCMNTVKKTLLGLKTIINKTRDELEIEIPDPFKKLRVGKVVNRREFLTLDEVTGLFNGFIDNAKKLTRPQYDAMQTFLFSCFTGLRYSDLKTLCKEDIQNGRICKPMKKTGDIVYIPLCNQAKALLALPNRHGDQRLLHVTENTYFNRHLKAAATVLGVEKRLFCHLARHTFATMCLTIGIPLEVTSKLLGHREIATTLIYAKMVNSRIDMEMNKFDTLGGFI